MSKSRFAIIKDKPASREDVALLSRWFLHSSSTGFVMKWHQYPLQIDIHACNYLSMNKIKMEAGLYASYRKNGRYHIASLPERLTLQRL